MAMLSPRHLVLTSGLGQHQPASMRPTQLVGRGSTTLAISATSAGRVSALVGESEGELCGVASMRSPSMSSMESGSFLWLSSSVGKRSAPGGGAGEGGGGSGGEGGA